MAKVTYFDSEYQEVATITVVTGRLQYAKSMATQHAKDKLMLIPASDWKHSHADKHTCSMIRRHTCSRYNVVVDMHS